MATVLGTIGDDNNLFGNNPENTIFGFDGNDNLYAGTGKDLLYGGDGNDLLKGGDGVDMLYGDDGDDNLDGGAGADHMYGGKGNDNYQVDDFQDVVDETGGKGIDTVYSKIVDYILPTGVENLVLEENSTARNGTGNDLDNMITGNSQANTLSGGAGNDILDGKAGADHMVGGAGNDTYYVDNPGDVVDETANGADSGGKDTVYSALSIDLTNAAQVKGHIEHLILTDPASSTAALNGTGDGFDNTIVGNDGKNVLIGGGGNDHLYGGGGDDKLTGGSGQDYLDGGAGIDHMTGGGGDDIYVVDQQLDKITETADGGKDTVYSSASYHVLADHVENMVLTGQDAINGDGNSDDNSITGNDGGNEIHGMGGKDVIFGGGGLDTLYGDDGSDTLYGGTGLDTLYGGAGADMMYGGKDDDYYYVDNPGDQVIEKAGEGDDTVDASIDYVLPMNVEFLYLQGSAIKGTGNALDNHILGNDQANYLYGGAGSDFLDGRKGADHMYGGKGNDTYVVDNPGDVVDETGGDGVDVVLAEVDNYILGTGIENLTLDNVLGVITGTGNGLANVLRGNDLSNTLYGLAGNDTLYGTPGTDHLYGGTGNDTYYIDSNQGAATIVDETTGGANDIDTVVSPDNVNLSDVTHFLGQIENVTLTGGSYCDATGNALANVLVGNTAANTLDGGDNDDTLYGRGGYDRLLGGNGKDNLHGGLGRDILAGGAGKDYFYFDTKLNALTNVDHIVDFTSGTDRIELSHKIFTTLPVGALAKSAFLDTTSAKAKHAGDRLIYDSTNGKLYYDDDGTGKHAATLIAVFDNHAKPTAADFDII
nr:hypothetical protein [uncultured Gellertiella sp.]